MLGLRLLIDGFHLQDGSSPLLIASQKGHISVAKLLLGCGANPNVQMEVSGRIILYFQDSVPVSAIHILLQHFLTINFVYFIITDVPVINKYSINDVLV